MAYTWHTVQSAERELRVVDDAIARSSRELTALRMRPPERRNKWAEEVHVKYMRNLRRRRDFLAGELEKARENERLGIPPLGPQPTRREPL